MIINSEVIILTQNASHKLLTGNKRNYLYLALPKHWDQQKTVDAVDPVAQARQKVHASSRTDELILIATSPNRPFKEEKKNTYERKIS